MAFGLNKLKKEISFKNHNIFQPKIRHLLKWDALKTGKKKPALNMIYT